jgi:hypothetical protein
MPPEEEARLIAAARAKGLSTGTVVREALDRILVEPPAPAGLPRSLPVSVIFENLEAGANIDDIHGMVRRAGPRTGQGGYRICRPQSR